MYIADIIKILTSSKIGVADSLRGDSHIEVWN